MNNYDQLCIQCLTTVICESVEASLYRFQLQQLQALKSSVKQRVFYLGYKVLLGGLTKTSLKLLLCESICFCGCIAARFVYNRNNENDDKFWFYLKWEINDILIIYRRMFRKWYESAFLVIGLVKAFLHVFEV